MSLLAPQMQAFMAIVRAETVYGAADQLHLTQTAVTQRIRALETKLRTTLFIRSRRGMLLTPEGEALLRYCQAAEELEGEALAMISGAAVEAAIQICITGPSTLMRARIIPQCMPVMQKFPQLLLKFDVTDTEQGEQALRCGHAQFAVMAPEDVAKEMDYKLLQSEKHLLVCSAKWKGRKLKEIIQNERIIDFNPTDQMTFNYLKQHDLFDLASHERHYINRIEVLAMLIKEGFGYSLLSKEFSKQYVDSGELMVLNQGRTYEYQSALAWYERPEPPGYFKALVDAIQ